MHESSRPAPAHIAIASVLQVRDGVLQALVWQRALEPFAGAWSLPERLSRAGRDARAVDPPPSGGEGRRTRALAPRAARDAERPGAQPDASGSLRRRTSGSFRRTSTPPSRPTRPGTRSTTCRPWRSTTKGSRSPAATACARSSRTRTSASRSHRRRSRSRSSATSTARHWATTSPPRISSACSCGEAFSSGRARSARPGPAGGRPAELYRFRSRTLEITDQFAVLRPPPVT